MIDTCQGDSGGPLMAFKDNRWVLAGITSSGVGCASPDYSGLYTRVSSYIGYIQNILDNPNTETSATTAGSITAAATPISGSTRVILSGSSSLILCILLFVLLLDQHNFDSIQ